MVRFGSHIFFIVAIVDAILNTFLDFFLVLPIELVVELLDKQNDVEDPLIFKILQLWNQLAPQIFLEVYPTGVKAVYLRVWTAGV